MWDRALQGADSSLSGRVPGGAGGGWGTLETVPRKVGQPDGTGPGRLGGFGSFWESETAVHCQNHATRGRWTSHRRVT